MSSKEEHKMIEQRKVLFFSDKIGLLSIEDLFTSSGVSCLKQTYQVILKS